MRKTTVYLTEELKNSLRRQANVSGRSEAELIREAIEAQVRGADQLRPRGRLFASGDPLLSDRAEDALLGFGEN
ncbi:MAG: CopG family transcriptional regulator [Candidatus Dormiibacterota bacterium]